MLVLNPTSIKSQYTDNYLAYSTKEKIVGIIKLPLEGNPNNTMGLIAHPDKITAISATSDGKYLFTSGSDDLAINIWYIDVAALEKNFFSIFFSLIFIYLLLKKSSIFGSFFLIIINIIYL